MFNMFNCGDKTKTREGTGLKEQYINVTYVICSDDVERCN